MILALLVKLPFLILLALSIILGYQISKLADLAPAKYREMELRTMYSEKPMKTTYIVLGGEKIHVEIAKSDDELAKGLMFREGLGENNGMLFVFDDASSHSMWMKNTLIPLDMVWIDDNFKIVHVEKNVQPCKSLACPSYGAPVPASYVLELNAGWLDKNNIPPNSYVQIPSLD